MNKKISLNFIKNNKINLFTAVLSLALPLAKTLTTLLNFYSFTKKNISKNMKNLVLNKNNIFKKIDFTKFTPKLNLLDIRAILLGICLFNIIIRFSTLFTVYSLIFIALQPSLFKKKNSYLFIN